MQFIIHTKKNKKRLQDHKQKLLKKKIQILPKMPKKINHIHTSYHKTRLFFFCIQKLEDMVTDPDLSRPDPPHTQNRNALKATT